MLSNPKILVATDFSAQSDNAILVAKKLQERCGGAISLVHVSGMPPLGDWLPEEFREKFLPEAFRRDIFSSLAGEMEKQMQRCELACVSEILFGDPKDELLKLIDVSKPDLFVLGDRGQGRFLGLGSLAQKMISSATVPMLVVKKDTDVKSVAGLLDPAYLSKDVVASGEELSYLFSADLHLISVVPDISARGSGYITQDMRLDFSEEQKKTISSRLKNEIGNLRDEHVGGQIEVDISKQKVHEAILGLLKRHEVDLVVLKKHNSGRLERLFIGSVSRRLLEKFLGNLLVLPE